jgi:hypothetical protein
MMDEPETLEDLLSRLPHATPLFVPEELLAFWFPPWFGAEGPNPDCIKAAEERAGKMGCTFGYDTRMQDWCFIKPVSN